MIVILFLLERKENIENYSYITDAYIGKLDFWGRFRPCSGHTQGTPYVGESNGQHMLDYLALVCLLALCVGHYYLIRGCIAIKTEAGGLTTLMDAKMSDTNNLLNEVAELLDEFVGASPSSAPVAQTGHPLASLLSTFLNNKTTMPPDHASTEEERPIRTEIESAPTTTTIEESESWERPSELFGA